MGRNRLSDLFEPNGLAASLSDGEREQLVAGLEELEEMAGITAKIESRRAGVFGRLARMLHPDPHFDERNVDELIFDPSRPKPSEGHFGSGGIDIADDVDPFADDDDDPLDDSNENPFPVV